MSTRKKDIDLKVKKSILGIKIFHIIKSLGLDWINSTSRG
jgi:hypothetical protein